jgi:anti-sigma factor RsiW
MNCDKARSYLPALALHGPEGSQGNQVERHLAGCPTCQAALEKTRKLQSLFSQARHQTQLEAETEILRDFVPEFHRRLASEIITRKPTIPERLRNWLLPESDGSQETSGFSVFRTPALMGFSACAAALMLIAGFVAFSSLTTSNSTGSAIVRHSSSRELPGQIASLHRGSVVEVESRWNDLVRSPGESDSIYVLDRVSYQPSKSDEAIVLQF